MQHLISFLGTLQSSISEDTFVKLTISNKRNKTSDLNNVFIKKVVLKTEEKFHFTYRYTHKDIIKIYNLKECLSQVEMFAQNEFFQLDLFTTIESLHLIQYKNGKSSLKRKNQSEKTVANKSHNKVKSTLIKIEDNEYLRDLGVLTADWKVKHNMHDKFRQINKYIEIMDGILKNQHFNDGYQVVDMGAGKGYLTLALYDYLTNVLRQNPKITGIELRENLVNQGNKLAKNSGFKNLAFKQGSIDEIQVSNIDVLIALHACDTATDDAIYKGIIKDAQVIICSPCCHKQVRKQLSPEGSMKSIMQHGILKERQAELLTDAIRALALEAKGYKTRVFEFISTEHTPKNVLIVAEKRSNMNVDSQKFYRQIDDLKSIYGLDYQYLEKKLRCPL